MRIKAVGKSEGASLGGEREVWVHVYADEVYDWPTVEKQLTGPQRVLLNSLGAKRKMAYYPHSPTPDEREEHGFMFDDFWVWSAK